MKLLLIGEYYSENLGDPLLCRTVERVIGDAFPKVEVIPFDMSGKLSQREQHPLGDYSFGTKLFLKLSASFPALFTKSALYRAYQRDESRYLRMWCALNALLRQHSFDLVVFAGGAIFMDYFAGIIHLIVRRCPRAKIIFHACGMGELHADSEKLLRWALNRKNVVSVSLRDSYERFTRLFQPKAPVSETFDTALLCSRYFSRVAEKKVEVGIGLIANEKFYHQQRALITYFLNAKGSWKAFVNGAAYDERFAVKVLLDAGVPEDQLAHYLVKRPRNAEELVQTVTGFDAIIAFRMHSQIVAASFGIPCFGFSWDEKVAQFYHKLGLPHNYTEDEVDVEKIQYALACCGEILPERALEQGKQSRRCLIQSIENALKKD